MLGFNFPLSKKGHDFPGEGGGRGGFFRGRTRSQNSADEARAFRHDQPEIESGPIAARRADQKQAAFSGSWLSDSPIDTSLRPDRG
jgi:hypothetical protein